MWVTRVLLVCALLWPRPSAAQAVLLDADLRAYGLTGTATYPITVDGRPGWLIHHGSGEWQVARVHETRSGLMAWRAVPGLCLELPWSLPLAGWWWWVGGIPKDADGDGDDDLTLRSIDGSERLVVVGLALNYCK